MPSPSPDGSGRSWSPNGEDCSRRPGRARLPALRLPEAFGSAPAACSRRCPAGRWHEQLRPTQRIRDPAGFALLRAAGPDVEPPSRKTDAPVHREEAVRQALDVLPVPAGCPFLDCRADRPGVRSAEGFDALVLVLVVDVQDPPPVRLGAARDLSQQRRNDKDPCCRPHPDLWPRRPPEWRFRRSLSLAYSSESFFYFHKSRLLSFPRDAKCNVRWTLATPILAGRGVGCAPAARGSRTLCAPAATGC